MTFDAFDELIAAFDELIAAFEEAIQNYKDVKARAAAATGPPQKWYAVWRLGDAADQLSWSGPYTEKWYARETFPDARIVNLTKWPTE